MERGLGWILFAWLMLLVAGVISVIDGISALAYSAFFADYGARFVAGNIRIWGWIALVMGIVEIVAAISVWRGGEFGRVAGIVIAAFSIFVQLFWIPIVPLWALISMVLAILVIYGLTVHGGRGKEA